MNSTDVSYNSIRVYIDSQTDSILVPLMVYSFVRIYLRVFNYYIDTDICIYIYDYIKYTDLQ